MNLAQALLLGLVQGATEFLPISSTAHLILLPWFFKFPDPGLVFDISLHLGTLLAILIYFRREWGEIIRGIFWRGVTRSGGTARQRAAFSRALAGEQRAAGPAATLLPLLLVATIPGIFFGIFFESWAETIFRTPLLIAITLVFFGIILWLVDTRVKHLNDSNYLSKGKAFFIGLWQALAILPGVSRSGATITGGLLVGLTREAAVKFSFLLSAPIIAGSLIAGIIKIPNSQFPIPNSQFLLGILTSFISGFLAIKFLLKFVQTHSFLPFVIYRILLAVLILITLV
ncbi:MAG: undecaprenyl-diphosphatase [Microgenomates group bacterium LiPW_16]|nr:MAG: undecaprenyl-diphosphatase [Microgenomates group bacterium LiPW_16]